MCDGVGNQQFAPEGSAEGKGSLYKASYGFCDVRNWEEKWRGREGDRERENRSVGIKLNKHINLCGLLTKRPTNVDAVHVCLNCLWDIVLGH